MLSGIIDDGEYFLLEHGDEDTTDQPSDLIYTGSLTTLSNSGEILRLYDPNGNMVDHCQQQWRCMACGNFVYLLKYAA